LRRVLPVYAAYLALSALWPLGDVDDHWRGTLALTLADATLTQATVFRALEQVAAFTLVGYMAAEFRGRDRRAERTAVLRVLTWSAVVSALLQGARGFQPATGASLVLFLLCQVASVAGCHLYTLQRDHVLALLKRQRT
jgi:VanZ family protein